jgi:SPP1 family predicted phage head-tail adaptor
VNINSLIKKHGENAKKNGVDIKLFSDVESISQYESPPKFRDYTGIRMFAVLIREEVAIDDVFLSRGKTFSVFKSSEIRHKGKRIYSDALLFEDDFNQDISIFNQSLQSSGCNLPSVNATANITTKARIKTINDPDYLQLSLRGGKRVTHNITIKYQSGVEKADLIKWGNRAFEILAIDNINEQNRLLVISVIEVLNG